MKTTLTLIALGCALLLTPSSQAQSTAKEDIKEAGKDMKNAGKATGEAAKNTGKATKKETKKAVNASARAVKKGAKVWGCTKREKMKLAFSSSKKGAGGRKEERRLRERALLRADAAGERDARHGGAAGKCEIECLVFLNLSLLCFAGGEEGVFWPRDDRHSLRHRRRAAKGREQVRLS